MTSVWAKAESAHREDGHWGPWGFSTEKYPPGQPDLQGGKIGNEMENTILEALAREGDPELPREVGTG